MPQPFGPLAIHSPVGVWIISIVALLAIGLKPNDAASIPHRFDYYGLVADTALLIFSVLVEVFHK